jgi:hypothetical protein
MKFVLGAVLVLVAVPAFCARHSPSSSHSKAGVHKTATTSHKAGESARASSPSRSGAHKAQSAGSAQNVRGRTGRRGRYARYRAPAPSYQLHPSPDRYKEIQQALADRGYFKGTVDGEWGSDSVDALKRFQLEHNAGDDGKVNSLSLIQLGLGPDRDRSDEGPPPSTSSALAPAAAAVSSSAASVQGPVTQK